MDSPYTFHSFTEADLSPLAELLHRYRAVVPIRPQTDRHVYLSPAFESGQYVLCAESDDRRLVAYAAFYPQGEMAWAHILVKTCAIVRLFLGNFTVVGGVLAAE